MKNDMFERFKKRYDEVLEKRCTKNTLDTSFLTSLRSNKLYGLPDDFDILDFIERHDKKDKLTYKIGYNLERVIMYDDFVREVCAECRRNIWFFIRLFIPSFLKSNDRKDKDFELNFGIVSLIYYYEKDINCILCNPRQTWQSTILSFLAAHTKLFKKNEYDFISFSRDSMLTMNIEKIINLIPISMIRCINDMNDKSYNKPNKYLCIFCEDFEFLDFKTIIHTGSERNNKVLLFGCGVVNKNLTIQDIEFIESNTKDVIDDYEFAFPHNYLCNHIKPEHLSLELPIFRVLFDTYSFFTDIEINKFRCMFNNEDILNSEIFRIRPVKKERIKVNIEETLCRTIEIDRPTDMSDDEAVEYAENYVISEYKNGNIALSSDDKTGIVQVQTDYKDISTGWHEVH